MCVCVFHKQNMLPQQKILPWISEWDCPPCDCQHCSYADTNDTKLPYHTMSSCHEA